MFSCITSKTAKKNFNNAEFNTAAYKYKKLLKEGDRCRENGYSEQSEEIKAIRTSRPLSLYQSRYIVW